MRAPLLAIALASAGCSERIETLEARVAELKAETDRLSRDVADLRKSGAGGPAAAAPSSPLGLEANALARALLAEFARSLPAAAGTDGPVEGVWRGPAPATPKDHAGPVEEVVHLASGGRLCGYGQLPPPSNEKRPFWGRWERHGRALLLIKDRWVGDHNEYDAALRIVDAVDAATLRTSPGASSALRVPRDQWRPLASLYEGRDVPIPGLPAWCLREE
jgi:hypothetical protein